MSSATIRLGMGQILVEGGKPEENLQRAVETISRAAAEGCHAVVLPECLNLGWTHPSARTDAPPIPGPHSDTLAAAARSHHLWVVAGLVEREGDRIFNTALLIDPSGEIILKHRKINELALAHDLYAPGCSVSAADTPFGRVGLAVCADNFPDSPEIGGALGRMGCDLILSPCAWAVDADHDDTTQPYGGLWLDSYTALTKRFPMTVVGVSNVGWLDAGPWKGRKCIGCSLAVGPGGEVLARGPYGPEAEELVVFEAPVSYRQGFAARASEIAASRVG